MSRAVIALAIHKGGKSMSVMKVDSERYDLVRDAKAFNAYVWTGLTEGKLIAIQAALETAKAHGKLFSIGQEVLTLLNSVGLVPVPVGVGLELGKERE